MSYQDEYYNRTSQQEFQIYKERETSWNVTRFVIALPILIGVIAMLDHWIGSIFSPVVDPAAPVSSTQAVMTLDSTCLFVPFVVGAFFLIAALVRAALVSARELRQSASTRRQVEKREAAAAPAMPAKRTKESTRKHPESSAWVDNYVREQKQTKERQREQQSLWARMRKQKQEAAERVRVAQSERLVASARASLQESVETRVAQTKRWEEQQDEFWKGLQ